MTTKQTVFHVGQVVWVRTYSTNIGGVGAITEFLTENDVEKARVAMFLPLYNWDAVAKDDIKTGLDDEVVDNTNCVVELWRLKEIVAG